MNQAVGRIFLVLVATLGLSACNGGYAPVAERSMNTSPLPETRTYVVRAGDTLYSIAWRYNLDYRALAKLNNIDSRYRIYAGQKIRLQASPPTVTQSSSPDVIVEPSRTVMQTYQMPTPTKAVMQPAPAKAAVVTDVVAKPAEPVIEPASADVVQSVVVPPGRLTWRWPAQGPLLDGFSSTATKGINIAGKAGDPVIAAGSGRVVYAGDGLRGYGILVIINHNQEFLSAYAHNSRLFVKENDMVNGGDKIAEVGSSGAARDMLHFEIRQDGQPVDPLKFLPRR